MTDRTVASLVDVVATAWAGSTMSEQTIVKFADLAARFGKFAAAHGVESIDDIDPSLCEAFVRAPGRSRGRIVGEPALATMHNRRAVLRALFRTARFHGIGLSDLTSNIDLPLRGPRGGVRPLAEDEADLVRFFADRGPEHRHATTTALLLAGVRTAEAGWLTVADLNLRAGTVAAHGSIKYDA